MTKYIGILQRKVLLDTRMWENKIDTHGGHRSNVLCLGRNTMSDSGIIVDTTVMVYALGLEVLCNVVNMNEGGMPQG